MYKVVYFGLYYDVMTDGAYQFEYGNMHPDYRPHVHGEYNSLEEAESETDGMNKLVRAKYSRAYLRKKPRRPDCTCIRDPYTDEVATYDRYCPVHGNPHPYFDDPKVIKYDNAWALDEQEARRHCKKAGDLWVGRRTRERFTYQGTQVDGTSRVGGTVFHKPEWVEW